MEAETYTHFRMVVPADVARIPDLRSRFIEYLEGLEIRLDTIEGWKLCATEAVTNAIVHGSERNPEKSIVVEWWSEGDAVRFAVADSGSGPPESLTRQPTLPEDLAESGRGLFIMDAFADEVRHWRSEKGYRLELARRVNSSKRLASNPEMERVLDELSSCYEGLSLFYRLGENLIAMENIARFVEQCMEDVLLAHDYNFFGVQTHPEIPESLSSQLAGISYVNPDESLTAALAQLLRNPEEIIWDESGVSAELPRKLTARCGAGCLLPIQSGGAVYGVLIAAHQEGERAILAAELNNLRTLSDIFGIAFSRMHLQEIRDAQQQSLRELEIATQIQKQLLPISEPPQSTKWEMIIHRLSALEIAGDFAEAVFDSEGNLVMTVIDVMGKGVSAALLAIIYRTALNQILKTPQPLPETLRNINRTLCEQLGDMTMFVTCSLVRVSSDCRYLEHVNAGHCPTIILDAQGEVRQIGASGPPLGLFLDSEYTTDRIELTGRESLLIVTDGCYEWSLGEEIFGWDAFRDFAVAQIKENPRLLWEHLQQLSKEKGSSDLKTLNDDETLLFWRLRTS